MPIPPSQHDPDPLHGAQASHTGAHAPRPVLVHLPSWRTKIVPLLAAFSIATLAACGGGGGGEEAADLDPPTASGGVLTMEGPDTAAFGTELNLAGIAFVAGSALIPEYIVAATTREQLDSILDGRPPPPVPGNAVAFVASEVGISMRIARDGYTRNWSYTTQPCSSGFLAVPCGDIRIDRTARTATFDGAVVHPSEGDDPEEGPNLATGPLTITGTLPWTAADERP